MKKIEEITVTKKSIGDDPALSKVQVIVTENGHDTEVSATS